MNTHSKNGRNGAINASMPSTIHKRKIKVLTAGYRWQIFFRVLTAIFGGYLLSAQASMILAAVLPLSEGESVIAAMLLAFLIYPVLAMRIFSLHNLKRLYLELLCLFLGQSLLVALIILFNPRVGSI